MSDDLVKRLRDTADSGGYDIYGLHCDLEREAADRIEKLEAALHQWDALIRHQYNGSRESMSDMNEAAGITAALLHGVAPWPETRVEKLEAALDDMAQYVSRADWHYLKDETRKALDAE